MFTGIIEALGKVQYIKKEGTNVHFTITSSISNELKIDQSLAHNGVCLTVVQLTETQHTVTAIAETLERSNLSTLQVGDPLNLERAMRANARLDGHFVQGHVDTTGICTNILSRDGSWHFSFEYEAAPERLLVDKGSISINGVSLTVVNPHQNSCTVNFSVAIIPYTFAHTNFHKLQVGDRVNLEFDVIGKYLAKYLEVYSSLKSQPS